MSAPTDPWTADKIWEALGWGQEGYPQWGTEGYKQWRKRFDKLAELINKQFAAERKESLKWEQDYMRVMLLNQANVEKLAAAVEAGRTREKCIPSEIAGIPVRWPMEEEIQQLEQQLAAEREKFLMESRIQVRALEQAEKQLAAAVEALTDIASTLGTSISKRAKAKAALEATKATGK